MFFLLQLLNDGQYQGGPHPFHSVNCFGKLIYTHQLKVLRCLEGKGLRGRLGGIQSCPNIRKTRKHTSILQQLPSVVWIGVCPQNSTHPGHGELEVVFTRAWDKVGWLPCLVPYKLQCVHWHSKAGKEHWSNYIAMRRGKRLLTSRMGPGPLVL